MCTNRSGCLHWPFLTMLCGGEPQPLRPLLAPAPDRVQGSPSLWTWFTALLPLLPIAVRPVNVHTLKVILAVWPASYGLPAAIFVRFMTASIWTPACWFYPQMRISIFNKQVCFVYARDRKSNRHCVQIDKIMIISVNLITSEWELV